MHHMHHMHGEYNAEAELENLDQKFTLSEDVLPELRDWKVGGVYTIVMEVEQKGIEQDTYYADEAGAKLKAFFKVLTARAIENESQPSPTRRAMRTLASKIHETKGGFAGAGATIRRVNLESS